MHLEYKKLSNARIFSAIVAFVDNLALRWDLGGARFESYSSWILLVRLYEIMYHPGLSILVSTIVAVLIAAGGFHVGSMRQRFRHDAWHTAYTHLTWLSVSWPFQRVGQMLMFFNLFLHEHFDLIPESVMFVSVEWGGHQAGLVIRRPEFWFEH